MGRAYSETAADWAAGPARVYSKLADLLVAFSPAPLDGSTVLDLGCGTGLATRAAKAVGARVVGADLALGMVLEDRDRRSPATVGDAVRLPFRCGAFDVVLAAFSLNHLRQPDAGVAEAARVGRVLLASTYAVDDDHPVKRAVEIALADFGWTRPAWYKAVQESMAAWGTVDEATGVIVRGGMQPIEVKKVDVAFPELRPVDMVAWRMGMAQSAPFVGSLPPEMRAGCVRRAIELLGPSPPPLVRRAIFLSAG
jgi:SAM-dependent methyltransferase